MTLHPEASRSPSRAVPARSGRRRSVAARILAAALAVVGGVIGLWALAAPDDFYRRFPGTPFSGWVAVDGPYNEHLVRDVGALYLALAAISVAAVILRGPTASIAARLAGLAWTVFSAPHLIYHAAHLHGWTASDAAAELVSLGACLLAGVVLLVLPPRQRAHGDDVTRKDRSA